MHLALNGLLLATLFYLGLMAAFCLLQERMIFQATRDLYQTPKAFGWDYEDVWVDTSLGRTHGWFVPHDNDRGVVLFSHGNGGNMSDRMPSLGHFRSLGLSVLVYDYGGYGDSTGKGSESRCYIDIQAMWRYLTETKGIPAKRIILFGRSLGGAVTADLACRVKPGAVVLESTFLSMTEVAAPKFWWLPVRWFIRHHFATKHKMAHIHAPLLVIHSPDDTLVPYAHGRQLFELGNEPKQFLEIQGEHHIGFVLCGEQLLEGWRRFLAEHMDWE